MIPTNQYKPVTNSPKYFDVSHHGSFSSRIPERVKRNISLALTKLNLGGADYELMGRQGPIVQKTTELPSFLYFPDSPQIQPFVLNSVGDGITTFIYPFEDSRINSYAVVDLDSSLDKGSLFQLYHEGKIYFIAMDQKSPRLVGFVNAFEDATQLWTQSIVACPELEEMVLKAFNEIVAAHRMEAGVKRPI